MNNYLLSFKQLYILLLLSLVFKPLFSQEVSTVLNKVTTNEFKTLAYSPNHITALGDTLYTFKLRSDNNLGVTVVNNIIYVSCAGPSSSSMSDNFFYRYNLDGTFIDSLPQLQCISGWGYRDLAFDGMYVLASEDTVIQKFNPSTMTIASQITSKVNTMHRGLAYDSTSNTIWSSNIRTGPIATINATTGSTIRIYGIPPTAVYGLALDKFNYPGKMALWVSEPTSSSSNAFRLSRMDTTNGLFDYSIDLISKFPTGSYNQGLEIINNHPNYPNKIIAIVVVAVPDGADMLAFVELNGAPPQTSYTYEMNNVFQLGGFIRDGFVRGNNLFLIQGNTFAIYDISGSQTNKISGINFDDEITSFFILGNYAYLGYGQTDGYFVVLDITNPSNPINLTTSPLKLTGKSIKKIFVSNNYAYISLNNNPFIILNVSNPASPTLVYTSIYTSYDIFVKGSYAYLTESNKFRILDISTPTSPIDKSNILLGSWKNVLVYGNYAYLSGGIYYNDSSGVCIINISDVNNPSLAGSFGRTDNKMKIGRMVALGSNLYFCNDSTHFISLNVSNPSIPSINGQLNKSGYEVLSMDSTSKIVYTYLNDYLKNISIVNPSNLTLQKNTEFNFTQIANYVNAAGNKLWVCGDEKLIKYNITTSLTDAGANIVFEKSYPQYAKARFILFKGNIGYLNFNNDTLHIIDFTNVNSPTLLAKYKASNTIIQYVIRDNYLYLVTEWSNMLEILNISDPSTPAKVGQLFLDGNIKDLYIPPAQSNNLTNQIYLYAAYYKNNYTYGYKIINVTNPASPSLTYDSQMSPYHPVAIRTMDNVLLLLQLDEARISWYLTAYDITNPTNYSILSSVSGSKSRAWGLEIDQAGFVYISLPDSNLIKMYKYNKSMNGFEFVKQISAISPTQFTQYIPLTTSSFANDDDKYSYYIAQSGYASYGFNNSKKFVSGSKGTTGVQIVAKKPPLGKVLLDMVIWPPQAANEGCTTSPAPGQYEYQINSVVPLTATANATQGWNFKEWTGSISGTNPSTTIVMDQNKTAIANFVKPQLNISEYSSPKCLCPEDFNRRVLVAQGRLTANEISDWYVSQIKFEGLGNCNEVKDFDTVIFSIPGKQFSSKYTVDNGYVVFNFSPALVVPKSSFLGWALYYALNDSLLFVKCPMDTVKEFGVRLKAVDVSAVPADYPNGLKVGEATTPFVKIACVFNIPKALAFTKIFDAVNSPQTTDNDSIVVCPGEYEENEIIIQKSISINGKGGPEVTKIDNINAHKLFSIKKKNVSIRGFKFDDVIIYSSNSIIEVEADNSTIENCHFENIYPYTAIRYLGVRNIRLSDIKIFRSYPPRTFQKYFAGIYFLSSKNIEILNSSISNIYGFGLEIDKCDTIKLINLNSISNYTGLFVNKSKYIYIDGGSFNQNGEKDKFISGLSQDGIKINRSRYGEIKNCENIYNNGYNGIVLTKTEDFKLKNLKINNNFSNGIELDSCNFIEISNVNIFKNSWGELILHSSSNCKIENSNFNGGLNKNDQETITSAVRLFDSDFNLFRQNKVQMSGTGLVLSNSNFNIIDNNDFTDNQSGVKLYSSSNNIFKYNIIDKNGNKSKKSAEGLSLRARSSKNLITHNSINRNYLPEFSQNSMGLTITDSSNDNDINNNSIFLNGIGIFLENAHKNKISHNGIYKNSYTGIFSKKSDNFILGNRFQENGTNEMIQKILTDLYVPKSFTAIHLDSSKADIKNNMILNDEGNGVYLENNSNATISENNIQGNKKFGVLNSDSTYLVNAQNNYWGAPSGPGGLGSGQGDKVGGNVNFTNWKTTPVNLIANPSKDTLITLANKTDSVSIFFNNLNNLNDTLIVTISDSLGWFTGQTSQNLILKDSLGAELKLIFNIPNNALPNTINRTKVVAKSKSDTTLSITKILFTKIYQQSLSKITIYPANAKVGQKMSYQFNAFGFDQYDNQMNFTKIWTATGGTIDSTGNYTADSLLGNYIVKVKASNNLEAIANVQIISSTPQLTTLEINPVRLVLLPNSKAVISIVANDQFDQPMAINYYRTATGGTFDSTGNYIAPADTGKYKITVQDSATSKTATADVFVVPGTLTPIYPKNNSTNIPVSLDLLWYEYPNVLSTKIYLSKDSTFSSLVILDSTGSSNAYEIAKLESNTTYFWKILIKTFNDSLITSPVWKFKTKPMITHKIVLPAGWSMISSFVEPNNPLLDTLLFKIKNKMVLLKDGLGRVYWPAMGIDQLTNWRKRLGFQIYMTTKDTLNIYGNEISPERLTLDLPKGWNIISYLRNSIMNIDSALSSIRNSITIVKNNYGQVYLPQFGINQIGGMLPGQGYQMFLKENQLFSYPRNDEIAGKQILFENNYFADRKTLVKYKFSPQITDNNMTLIINSDKLSIGDEIAVYNSNNDLIGAASVEYGFTPITIWGDNALTNEIFEGAKEKEPLKLKIWNSEKNFEEDIKIENIHDILNSGDIEKKLTYNPNSVYLLKVATPFIIPGSYNLSQNYPNPFNPVTTIRYELPENTKVKIEVFNMLGQKVETLVDTEQKAGYYTINFGKPGYASGVYIYRMIAGDGKYVKVKKMMLLK